MVNPSNMMAKATKRGKVSGKSRDVHRGNISAYQRELDSIIKDLKDSNDSTSDADLIRSRAGSETSVMQRNIATKSPSDAKHRRQINGSETTKPKTTLNHVQLEKLESTAFAALQVIQSTVVSIEKLQVEDSHDELEENKFVDETTQDNNNLKDKRQKGTPRQQHNVYRSMDSKLRNLGDHRSKTNAPIPDQRGVAALRSGDFKPLKATHSSEPFKTFTYETKGRRIFQNDPQKGMENNLKPRKISPDMSDHNTDGIFTDLQLQSAMASTQPISHVEKGNFDVEAKRNARTKINQTNSQKSMACSSLRSSEKQMTSTRMEIDSETVRSKPKQSGSDSIHKHHQLVESSTQTDINHAELDASIGITHPDQNHLPGGFIPGREGEGGEAPDASDGDELQGDNAEKDPVGTNGGNGRRDLQEELDKLKEGNEDLERQLRETIDFEVQAMKAYIKLVKQHRQLKRKLQGKCKSLLGFIFLL